jgi:polyisoprenoid-binding protein YceI
MAAQVQTQAGARSVWALDTAHTLVEFSAKHMMFTTVKGRFADFSGSLSLEGDDPRSAEVEVTINAASVDTREEKRDAHLRSADFLDVEHFPTITFKSRRVEEGKDGLRLIGDLTIRGTTREVALNAEYLGEGASPWGTTVRHFTAETTINRSDFGLTFNVALETGGVLVSDKIKLSLEVEAIKQG